MPNLQNQGKTRPNAEENGKVVLSKQVLYQYKEENGKRTGEGLLASGRCYPGVLVNKRFYYGLHQKNRFVPGIVAWGRFIPGLVTRRGFYPGIITSQGFQPGIIAMGVFVPGIVHGRNFVPGILNLRGFLPGCFTTDGKFLPGRFINGRFENGVIDGRVFIPADHDSLTARDAHILSQEGYGLVKVRRYEPIGGLPIRGAIVGKVGRMCSIVPCGLLTNAGVILGGLWDKQNLPTLDRSAELGELGIETDELGDLPDLEKKFEEMIDDLSDGLFSPFGEGQSGVNLQEALEQLGQGENELIDRLNREQAEYWGRVLGQNAGGMISGSGNSNDKNTWSWVECGRYAGVGAVAGASEGLGGMAAGALVGALTYALEYLYHEVKDAVEGGSDESGGTSAPGEEGEDGNSFSIQPEHAPIGITIAKETFIAIKKEGFGTGQSTITITRTDTGVLVVMNYDEMARAARISSDQRINLGLNPVTGNATLVTPLASDPRAVLGKALHQMYVNPVVRPLDA